MSTQELPSPTTPDFLRPPVVETVLGVQFEPLPKMHTGFLGAFWKELYPELQDVRDAPTLEPQFERFGDEQFWQIFGQIRLKLETTPAVRLQLRNELAGRMVQIQNGRLHYNWFGSGNDYARFSRVKPEFDATLLRLRELMTSSEVGEFSPNQWEITYVNQIPRNELWDSPRDWPRIIKLIPQQPALPSNGPTLESIAAQWHYEIPPQRGRIHVELQHGKDKANTEVLTLKLTARGPINNDMNLDYGLNLGHTMIVETFFAITTATAHEFWGVQS